MLMQLCLLQNESSEDELSASYENLAENKQVSEFKSVLFSVFSVNQFHL